MHTDPNNPHADLAIPTPKRKALLTVTPSPFGVTVEGPAIRLVAKYDADILGAIKASQAASKALWDARLEEKAACELPKGTRGRPGRIEAAEALARSLITPNADRLKAAHEALQGAFTRLEAERQVRLLEALRWLAGDGEVQVMGAYHRRTVDHGAFTVKVELLRGLLNDVELRSKDDDVVIRITPTWRSRLLLEDGDEERRADAWEFSICSSRRETMAEVKVLASMVAAASDIQADLVSHTVLGDHHVGGIAWKALELIRGE